MLIKAICMRQNVLPLPVWTSVSLMIRSNSSIRSILSWATIISFWPGIVSDSRRTNTNIRERHYSTTCPSDWNCIISGSSSFWIIVIAEPSRNFIQKFMLIISWSYIPNICRWLMINWQHSSLTSSFEDIWWISKGSAYTFQHSTIWRASSITRPLKMSFCLLSSIDLIRWIFHML